ncbi:hypothetical protein EVAR_58054_1 [Eumeta japonica]|uniref:Uncharacterized protein n=1 Tax=Eumeta variegata TaxID=151549 RepID=A0A4C1YY38_EUMVA|nr:hypothetical protein EVAR_58054_1 [Eumeta japonica]
MVLRAPGRSIQLNKKQMQCTASPARGSLQHTKLCHSELAANDILRRIVTSQADCEWSPYIGGVNSAGVKGRRRKVADGTHRIVHSLRSDRRGHGVALKVARVPVAFPKFEYLRMGAILGKVVSPVTIASSDRAQSCLPITSMHVNNTFATLLRTKNGVEENLEDIEEK